MDPRSGRVGGQPDPLGGRIEEPPHVKDEEKEVPQDAQPQRERRASLVNAVKTVAFIVLIQVAALFFTRVNAPVAESSGYSYAPAGSSPSGSVWNVVILVVFVFAATLGAVWLTRRRKLKIFMGVVFFGTALALFLLTLLTSIDVSGYYLDQNTSFYLSIVLSGAAVIVLSIVTFRRRPAWFALVITGLLSAEIGSYFASTIPLITALLLPLAFSVYDIYTVFRGPLKTLLSTLPAESLTAISSKVGDFSIGTGDTVFYAMLPALAYYQITLGSALFTMIAVDIGVLVTLYLLNKAKLLPGLPIPMAMGLAVVLVLGFL